MDLEIIITMLYITDRKQRVIGKVLTSSAKPPV